MAAVVVAAFLYAPAAEGFRQSRIIFFHVPNAMVAVVAFIVAMIYAVQYLRGKRLVDDAKSAISAELGLLFAVLATVTGLVFARVEWGSWWNWDARESSILMLLLVYAAYFALRAAVDGAERRAALSAVYAIAAIAPMVLFTFVVSAQMSELHPKGTLIGRHALRQEYRVVLYSAMAGFLGLYLWLFRTRTALAEVRMKLRRY
jgi:heme exporter protein C